MKKSNIFIVIKKGDEVRDVVTLKDLLKKSLGQYAGKYSHARIVFSMIDPSASWSMCVEPGGRP